MSAQPSSTSTSAPAIIPGAALPTSSKPKRNKKKLSAKANDVIATPEAEAHGATTAPAAEEPAITGNDINRGSREKGPVEEVITKRIRQLGKKIQRFKGYVSQPHDSLNADQKSAINSLPTLESIYKELEDLAKQVEPVELEQAGKIRELKEQAKQEAEGTVAGKVSEFQASLSTPLSLFLRLHQLLHPARSSDHEHLTFARLDLPSNLQDEVQATDVLRVGRMYEDLVVGGEQGSGVIAGLIKGPIGEDEENDHVHHLLSLLSSSNSISADDSSPEEADLGITQSAPEVEEPVSKAASDDGIANGDVQEEGEQNPEPVSAVGEDGNGALNFLQEDELENVIQQSQSNETIPPQFIQEPVTTIPPPPIDSAPIQSGNGTSALANFNASGNFDWAADEDLDEATEAAHIRQAFALPPSGTQTPALQSEPQGRVEEQTVPTEEEEPAIALIQENELANAHIAESAVDSPSAIENSSIPAPPAVEVKETPVQTNVNGNKGRGHGQNRGRAGRNTSGRNQNQQQNQQQQHNQGQKGQSTPRVDEDGFQVVGRQLLPSSQRGRGNANTGRGRNDGQRGRGNQNGRGRGGPGGRGGARNVSNAGTSGADRQNQGQQAINRQPRQQREPSQSQVKPAAPATIA
ncbi:uncharacterized protein L201_002499 [Kwoniella dendrophila CBS 6074]|uniref:Uncharacterized protein n=1 Tax=Kwoniella dendrophila CBS 6074 TaxID=1295534 RepID=A0AAX4JS74_9TREE